MSMENEDIRRWDTAADYYQRTFRLGINDYNRSALELFHREGMIFPGAKVLDIGCGVGKYGTYLAELGCYVTLTDISPRMLAHAAQNMAHWPDTELICGDFSAGILTGERYHKSFDLVMSTMSPAVSTPETIRKACDLSRGWVYLTNFCAWQQPLRDKILHCAGLEARGPFDRSALRTEHEALLRILGDMHIRYTLDYVPYNWSDPRTVAEMADYMLKNYCPADESLPSACEALEKVIPALAGADGLLADRVETVVARIRWQTSEE